MATFTADLPGAGEIDVLETAWLDNVKKGRTPVELPAAVLLAPAAGRLVFGRGHAFTTESGPIAMTVKPTVAGASLLRQHRYLVTLRLWITYTPSAGASHTIGWYGLHLDSRGPTVEPASPPRPNHSKRGR